ncbi:MAG TPA: GNAT family N-acetyltransferase [Saprospiraceae bacterium]|nr:GNAT family N-acetyltransferase [Saprospiraceae bacterium]
MKVIQSFETERLLLKAVDKEDGSFILELFNTPQWIANIGDRNVRNIEQAETYIEEKMRPQIERLGFGNYIMIRKLDGRKIGTCGLYDREGLDGIDIGYALLPQFEKQNYAFEGASKMLDLAKHYFNLTEIVAITTPENIPSQKILEKLGLKFVKTIKLPSDDKELNFYKLSLR